MSGWVLDTNVLSELRKGSRSHAAVTAWAEDQAVYQLFVSRVTLGEIQYGIEQTPNPAFRLELEQWVQARLLPWFSGRILEVDQPVIVEWRRMVEKGRKRNHTFSQPDLFIAATAKVHGLGVATRNVEDFALAGVAVTNLWKYRSLRS